jgi:hypothetical protein
VIPRRLFRLGDEPEARQTPVDDAVITAPDGVAPASFPADGAGGISSDSTDPADLLAAADPAETERSLVVVPARKALQMIRSGVSIASDATIDRVGQAVEGVERTWSERPGARVRRIRRMAAEPLPYLYDVHPEARAAHPVDVGLETIDVDDVAGTAVGGGAQRGGDFLPLKQFRGGNWLGRWQRLRSAHAKLSMLPPIDVLSYADKYWVVDGHNRVGLALYMGQVAIDANVVELVRPGARRTEPILPLASTVAASKAVRTAAGGLLPSLELANEDAVPIGTPETAE